MDVSELESAPKGHRRAIILLTLAVEQLKELPVGTLLQHMEDELLLGSEEDIIEKLARDNDGE